jgi:hypothetical protein
MDALLLQRELGVPLGRRSGRSEPTWGTSSESLVRKLQLERCLDQGGATSITDVAWDCSGSYMASAGDDCALHVYNVSGRLLRSFDPVRTAAVFAHSHAALLLCLRCCWPFQSSHHGAALQSQGHTASIMALQYLPGTRGATLLTGGGDKQVHATPPRGSLRYLPVAQACIPRAAPTLQAQQLHAHPQAGRQRAPMRSTRLSPRPLLHRSASSTSSAAPSSRSAATRRACGASRPSTAPSS